MDYLVLYSIGPVQSFISQARKLQDLFAGSRMLSKLAAHIADWLRKKNMDVIFPAAELDTAPNRILFRVTNASDTDVKTLCLDCENYLRDFFRTFAKEQLASVECNLQMNDAVWNQLRTFLQIYWAAVPLGDDYGKAYKQLVMRLGTAKTVRSFGAFSEDPARKCSITGQQNALFVRNRADVKYISDSAQDFDERIRKQTSSWKYLQEGEALSALSFVKRCYGAQRKFPSVAQICLMGEEPPEDDDQLKTLLKQRNLSSYYAAIRFDGDHMGEQYSKCGSSEEQRILSGQLSAFAAYARKHIETDTHGRLIYAGGEDFLGFIPIQEAFPALRALRNAFVKTVIGCTFSAGVVFAHYKEPLGEVLQGCRHMEHIAKNSGRNAFAIAAMKHSGSVESAACPFLKDTVDYLQTLDLLFQAQLNKDISTNYIYSLLQEFQPLLLDKNKGFGNDFTSMLQQEAARWLQRSLSDEMPDDVKQKKFVLLSEALKKLFFPLPELEAIRLLRILAFLVREGGTLA